MYYIGIAGYGSDNNVLEKEISNTLSPYHYVLTNDMHITLISTLDDQDGLAVIAGTGAIVMTQFQGYL